MFDWDLISGWEAAAWRQQNSNHTAQTSIQLNMAKSKLVALQDARTNGLQLLGTCLGPTQARERFLRAKISLADLLHQHVLLLLKTFIQQDLRHLQRSLPSHDLPHLWTRLDNSLYSAIARIRSADRQGPHDPAHMSNSAVWDWESSHSKRAPLSHPKRPQNSQTPPLPNCLNPNSPKTRRRPHSASYCHKRFIEQREALAIPLPLQSERSCLNQPPYSAGSGWTPSLSTTRSD